MWALLKIKIDECQKDYVNEIRSIVQLDSFHFETEIMCYRHE